MENYIIVECIKNNANQNRGEMFYYWRDSNGVEVDLVIDKSTTFLPLEIKSAQTFSNDFGNNLKKIKKYSDIKEAVILYDGDLEFETSDGTKVLKWTSFLKSGE